MKAVFIGGDSEVANFTTVSLRLRWPDFTPLMATTPTTGLEMVEGELPDIVLFHVSSSDGMLAQTIQDLRRFSAVPLLVMGTQPDQLQVITALEWGADDYVRLPCGLTELMARVVAVLRRAGTQKFDGDQGPLVKGDLLINPSTYEAFLGNRKLKLTVTEFRLLHILASNCGRVVPHETLERSIWGDGWNCNGLVKKYVQRLRSKLTSDTSEPSCITSIHGVGYRFAAPSLPSRTQVAATRESFAKKTVPMPLVVDTSLDSEKVLIPASR